MSRAVVLSSVVLGEKEVFGLDLERVPITTFEFSWDVCVEGFTITNLFGFSCPKEGISKLK